MENRPRTLSPPQMRMAYTPPPKKEGVDDNSHSEDERYGSRLKDSVAGAATDDIEDKIPVPISAPKTASRTNSGAKRKLRKQDATSPPPPKNLAGMLRRGIVDHQLGLSVNLMLFVGLSWLFFPRVRSKMDAFFCLSYATPSASPSQLYAQGPRDLYLVLSFVVLFTAIRAFMLDYILQPLGALVGLDKRKTQARFAEQLYLLLYYVLYWNLGLYLFVRDTPGALPPGQRHGVWAGIESLLISLWTGFPRLLIDGTMKLYYLSQLAFWAQQILVIHLEEKRKDHYQMLTHHFVTVALMATSYAYRQCRVGNAVLVCMDIVDLIFPLAKILRYLNWQRACDACFALFVVVWLAARHAAYLTICWSIYAHVNRVVMFYGTFSLSSGEHISSYAGTAAWTEVFQPFLKPHADTLLFNGKIKFGFLGLLLGLQGITLAWFVMICRVVARVLRGEGADDSRSDDEEDSEEMVGREESSESDLTNEKPKFIEVETTTEFEQPRLSTGGSGTKVASGKKKAGFSSGLNLGERKEILNRIGCLSEEQLAREREKKGESSRPGSGGH